MIKNIYKGIIGLVLGATAYGATTFGFPSDYYYLVKWEYAIEDRGVLGLDEYWTIQDKEGKKGALVDLRTRQEAGSKISSGYALVVYDRAKNIANSVFLGNKIDKLNNEIKVKEIFGNDIDTNSIQEFIDDRIKKISPTADKNPLKIGSIKEKKSFINIAYASIGSDTLNSDTFDRADNADLGTDWTPVSGAIEIVSNTAYENDGTAQEKWADFSNSANANYEVRGTYQQIAGGGVSDAYIQCRLADSENWYELRISTFGQDVKIRKTIATVTTELADFDGGYSEGNNYVLRFLCDGTSLSGYVDGGLRVSTTDSDITNMNVPAIKLAKGSSVASTLNDWSVIGTLTSGASPSTVSDIIFFE